MAMMTMIARVSDGLILCASMEPENEAMAMTQYKQKAKELLVLARAPESAPRFIVDDPPYYFLYIIEDGVIYLTLSPRSHPKALTVSFLEELQREFATSYGANVPAAQRPYEFIKFDTFIQKTKKLFSDPSSQRNLSKVSEELAEVHQIFSKSINEIMNRGEKLNSVSQKSSVLVEHSFQYQKSAKDLRRMMLLKKWMPIIVIVAVLVLFILFRWYY